MRAGTSHEATLLGWILAQHVVREGTGKSIECFGRAIAIAPLFTARHEDQASEAGGSGA